MKLSHLIAIAILCTAIPSLAQNDFQYNKQILGRGLFVEVGLGMHFMNSVEEKNRNTQPLPRIWKGYFCMDINISTKLYSFKKANNRFGLNVHWLKLGCTFLDQGYNSRTKSYQLIHEFYFSLPSLGFTFAHQIDDNQGIEMDCSFILAAYSNYGGLGPSIFVTPQIKYRYKGLCLGVSIGWVSGFTFGMYGAAFYGFPIQATVGYKLVSWEGGK